MRKQIAITLGTVTLLPLLLAGCSNSEQGAPTASATPKASTSLSQPTDTSGLPVQFPKTVPLVNNDYVTGSAKEYSNTAGQVEDKVSLRASSDQLDTAGQLLKAKGYTVNVAGAGNGSKIVNADNGTYEVTVSVSIAGSGATTLDYRIVTKAVN